MKIVYADVVMAVNFSVDFVLLYLLSSFLHIKINILRCVVASVFGGVFAVFSVVVAQSYPTRILLIILSFFLMCFFCFGKRTFATYIRICILFFAFSVMLGGVVHLFLSDMSNSRFYGLKLIFVSVLFSLLSIKMSELLRTDITTGKVRIKVELNNITAECFVMCDSGNILRDPYNSMPVILLDETMKKTFFCDDNSQLLSRLIPAFTISGRCLVEAVTPDAVYICKKKKFKVNATVGFVSQNIKLPEGCCGIIPSVLVDNL